LGNVAGRAVACLLACAVLTTLLTKPAESSGVHEDFGRFFSFLTREADYSLDGGFTRTDAVDHEASIFTLAGTLPYRTFLLVNPEISYVSRFEAGTLSNTFGDARVRLRARVWAPGRGAFYVVPGFRVGTGSPEIFPYATASFDVELGVGYVYTSSVFGWWLYAGGVYPTRVDDVLKDGDAYGNYATASAGVMLLATNRIVLEGGLVVLAPASGAVREIYTANVDLNYSPLTTFYALFQAEAGDRARRAIDFAIGAGVRVNF
jgi:hypothetical protein